MFIRHFGVTGQPVTLLISGNRRVAVYRTMLQISFWTGTQFDPVGLRALWDTGSDFFTVSEQFADAVGIDWASATEHLGSSGTAGSSAGVVVPIVIRLGPIRDLAFRIECQVLLGTDFPRPLLGNRFVRRNFTVQTIGERRTFFRLRDLAPDAVSVAQFRNVTPNPPST